MSKQLGTQRKSWPTPCEAKSFFGQSTTILTLSAVRVPADVSGNRFRAFATNCRSCRIHVSWPHRTLTPAEEWHLVWSPRDRGLSRTPTQHETRKNSASRRHRRPIVRLRVRRQASHVDPSLTLSWLPFANDHLNGDPTLHAQDEDATLAGSPRCQEDGNRARVSSRLMRLPRYRPCPEAVRTIHSGDPAKKNRTAFARRPSGRGSSFLKRRPERIDVTDVGNLPAVRHVLRRALGRAAPGVQRWL